MVLTSIVANCVLWILVSLLTKPDPEKKLVEFYQLARPLGWWNPIARKAKLNPAGHRPILNGPGIALVGTVMVAAGIIGFSCFYVARWETAIVASVIVLISASYFRVTYRKYLV